MRLVYIHLKCLFDNLSGLRFTPEVKIANHAKFVDNTILMGGASVAIENRFKVVLDNFMEASGGLENSTKSQIYTWNISTSKRLKIREVLRFSKVEHRR